MRQRVKEHDKELTDSSLSHQKQIKRQQQMRISPCLQSKKQKFVLLLWQSYKTLCRGSNCKLNEYAWILKWHVVFILAVVEDWCFCTQKSFSRSYSKKGVLQVIQWRNSFMWFNREMFVDTKKGIQVWNNQQAEITCRHSSPRIKRAEMDYYTIYTLA